MNYLILGANAAGLSAAVRILKNDKQAKVTVLEKSDVVSFGSCGLPYYIAGEFSDANRMIARSADKFIEIGIDLRVFHLVEDIDFSKKVVRAKDIKANKDVDISYDKLLIATGASPIKASFMDDNLENVFHLHTKYDGQAIRDKLNDIKKVVIIGGGYIGLETAEAFIEQGKKVTLIEAQKRIVQKSFDADLTPILEKELIDKGINLCVNEKVFEIRGENGKVSKVITDKDEYPADLVLVSIGFSPNTQFLQGKNISLDRQGAIVINDYCETSIPDVFAAGDCATVRHKIAGNEYIPLATTANKLGRLVGDNISGKKSKFIGTLGSSGVRVFSLEAGRTGISQEDAEKMEIEYGVVSIKDKNHTDYISDQSDMYVKLIYDKITRKILGGQIVGNYLGGAVHRVDALAVAIYAGITVEELGFMDFIYAPPFARTWDILNVAGNVAK